MLSVMTKAKKHPFNVKAFLSTVDGGRTVATYRKNRRVFAQGDPADSSSTSKRARSRFASYPSRARRRSSPFTERATSSAKAA